MNKILEKLRSDYRTISENIFNLKKSAGCINPKHPTWGQYVGLKKQATIHLYAVKLLKNCSLVQIYKLPRKELVPILKNGYPYANSGCIKVAIKLIVKTEKKLEKQEKKLELVNVG